VTDGDAGEGWTGKCAEGVVKTGTPTPETVKTRLWLKRVEACKSTSRPLKKRIRLAKLQKGGLEGKVYGKDGVDVARKDLRLE